MEKLQARYSSVNSFYGKATVDHVGEEVRLYSYGLLVAVAKGGECELRNIEDHSSTTRRHVAEFVRQFAPRADYQALYKGNKIARYW